MKVKQQSSFARITSICFFLMACLFIVASFANTALGAEVTLAWDANSEENLAGYKLYYESGTSGAPYDGTGLTEGDSPIIIYVETPAEAEASTHVLEDPALPVFPLSGLVDGATYYFALTAFDTDGLESDYSDEISYATSAAASYTITASATGNGAISPDGAVSVAEGADQTITITADDNHHIAGVTVDGSSVGQVDTYTFEAVAADHTISALFEIDTFTITATAGENGSISPQGVTSASYGASLDYTITPTDGYHISDVLVDGSSVGQVSTYAFENISTWHTIAAVFEEDDDGGVIVEEPADDQEEPSEPPADGDDTTTGDDTSTGDDSTTPDPPADGNQAPYAPTPLSNNVEAQAVGPVTLAVGAFSDPDSGDSHLKTEWRVFRSEDGGCVFDIASTSSLTEFSVPEIMLDEYATYYWNARFFDNNHTASDWSETAYFSTGGSDTDMDSDGIPDSQEVDESVDMNQDGVPDAEQEIVKSIVLPQSNQTIGLGIEDSETAMSILFMEAVDLDNLAVTDTIKSRAQKLPLGLINFKLSVAAPGDTAIVTVYFSEKVNPNAKWMKLDVVNGIWLDYSGYAQLSDDRLSLTLELVDGGFGDDDGVANGIIIDPAGLELYTVDLSATVADDGSVDSGSDEGSGGCFITGAAGTGRTGKTMAVAGILLLAGAALCTGRRFGVHVKVHGAER
jgi:hypothetical protein